MILTFFLQTFFCTKEVAPENWRVKVEHSNDRGKTLRHRQFQVAMMRKQKEARVMETTRCLLTISQF